MDMESCMRGAWRLFEREGLQARTDEELLAPGEAEGFPSEPCSSERTYGFGRHFNCVGEAPELAGGKYGVVVRISLKSRLSHTRTPQQTSLARPRGRSFKRPTT